MSDSENLNLERFKQLMADDQVLLAVKHPNFNYTRYFVMSDRLINSTDRKKFDRLNTVLIQGADKHYLETELIETDLVLNGTNWKKYEIDPRVFKGTKIAKFIELNFG